MADVFALTETRTDMTWLGKPVFRTVVDFGAHPSSTTKNVNHGVTDIDEIVNCYYWTNNGTTTYFGPNNNTYSLATDTQVSIIAIGGWSGYNTTYFILEYTKV